MRGSIPNHPVRSFVLLLVAALLMGADLGVLYTAVPALSREWQNAYPDAILVTTQQELQSALNGAVYGTTITVGRDIALTSPLSINKSGVAVKLQAAGEGVTLTASSTRHLRVSGGSVDLFFENITLDGRGTAGGVTSSAANLSLSGVVIQNCYSSGNGGGVEALSGVLDIEQGTVIRNNRAAAYGGGVATGTSVTLQMDGGEISANTAGAYGGGIFGGVASTIRMDGGTVKDNKANLGGGIYCGLRGYLLLDGGEIASNTAAGYSDYEGMGGGIFAVTSDITLDGVSVAENEARNGGGIYVTGDGSDIVLISGEIRGNRATGTESAGGGAYLDTAYSVPNTFTINGGVFSGNEAQRGGGVFAAGSTPPPGSSSPTGKVPSAVAVNGSAMVANKAGFGGAVCADPGATVTMDGGEIQGNNATDGGGIWIEPLDNILVAEGAGFAENTAGSAVFYPAQEHIALHRRNIRTDRFSGSFSYAYNNYDIVYQSDGTDPTHTVRFEYGDAASGNTEAERVLSHGQAVGELPAPVKTGHRLLGWYSAEQGGVKWSADTPVTGDATLYARWEAKTYTIYFDYNDGPFYEGDTATKQVVYGQRVGELPTPVPPTGMSFSGWYEESSGEHYFPATIYREDRSITLTAQWTQDIRLHTVTFDYRGGEGIEQERIVPEQEPVGPLPQGFSPGFLLRGWFDEDEREVFPAETVDAPLALHARWTPVPWTVTFDYGEADRDGLPDYSEADHNKPVDRLPRPTLEGHTMLGWFTAPDGGREVTETTPITENMTLYARWEPNTYSLYFDYQNADTSQPEKKTVFYGEKIGSLPLPVRSGYVFNGWYTLPGDAGRYIGGGTSGYAYDRTRDSTTYAGWHGDLYTVTLDYQGADAGVEFPAKQVIFGDNIGYLPFPEKEDFRFAGWFTQPDGRGKQYFIGTEYLTPENLTLYAYWTDEDPPVTSPGSAGTYRPSGVRRGTAPQAPAGPDFDTIPDETPPHSINPGTGWAKSASRSAAAGLLLALAALLLHRKR